MTRASVRPTSPAGAALLGLVLLGAAGAGPTGVDPPAAAEIAAARERAWEQVHALLVAHEARLEPVQPAGIIRKYSFMMTMVTREVTFAFKGPKRYVSTAGPLWARVLAPDVDPDYDVIPGGRELVARREADEKALGTAQAAGEPRERPEWIQGSPSIEVAFDGDRLLQKQASGDSVILPRDNMALLAGNFMHEYLVMVGKSLPNPAGPPPVAAAPVASAAPAPAADLARSLAAGDCRVAPETETVEGAPCVVVSCGDDESLWLDPALGFAVRRRERRWPGSRVLSERVTHHEFTEAAPGLWLPRRCVRESCAPPRAPAEYRGRPLYREVFTVTRLTINDVPDAIFHLEADPGAQVADATRLPAKQGRQQFVGYRMPADARELDRVVAEAVRNRGRRPRDPRLKFIVLNVVGVAILLAYSGYRHWSHRRRAGRSTTDPDLPRGPAGADAP